MSNPDDLSGYISRVWLGSGLGLGPVQRVHLASEHSSAISVPQITFHMSDCAPCLSQKHCITSAVTACQRFLCN